MANRNPVKHHGRLGSHGPEGGRLFASLPMALARDTELSAPARSVAMYVWSHDERFEQSARDVADALGMSRNTVAKALDALQERGWFVRQRITANSEVWHLQMTNRPFSPDEVSTLSGVAQEMSHLPSTGSGIEPPTGSLGEPPTGSGNEPHSSESRSAPEVHDWSSARTDLDETGLRSRSLADAGTEAKPAQGPAEPASADDPFAGPRPAWVVEAAAREERAWEYQPATAGGLPPLPWE